MALPELGRVENGQLCQSKAALEGLKAWKISGCAKDQCDLERSSAIDLGATTSLVTAETKPRAWHYDKIRAR